MTLHFTDKETEAGSSYQTHSTSHPSTAPTVPPTATLHCSPVCLSWCSELNGGPPKRYVRILIAGICEYDLIWQKGLCRCDQVKNLKVRSFRIIWVSLNLMVSVPIRDDRGVKRRAQGRTSSEDRGRDWSDAVTRTACSHQHLEGAENLLSAPSLTLISDFCGQHYGRIQFCCFKSPSLW